MTARNPTAVGQKPLVGIVWLACFHASPLLLKGSEPYLSTPFAGNTNKTFGEFPHLAPETQACLLLFIVVYLCLCLFLVEAIGSCPNLGNPVCRISKSAEKSLLGDFSLFKLQILRLSYLGKEQTGSSQQGYTSDGTFLQNARTSQLLY
jgi:hypothetical protein